MLLSLVLPVDEGDTDVSICSGSGTGKIREHELSNHISVPISSLAIRGRRKTISGKAVYKARRLLEQNNYCCYKGACDASSAPQQLLGEGRVIEGLGGPISNPNL